MEEFNEFIPFGRPRFDETDIQAVVRVLQSGWVGMGSETLAFEKELAEFLQVSHVITVNSCTSALQLSLIAHGVGEGDEVIVPSLTWCATANAAIYLGATIRFCDVDPATLSISSDSVLKVLTPKTKAVIPVHFGGRALDVVELRNSLPTEVAIVEDAAHAFGASYSNSSFVGSLGNLTCFSFYANKNLSTGEGGAIATNDAELADRIRSLRLNGLDSTSYKRFLDRDSPPTPEVMRLGYKMNYFDLLASIGRSQLQRMHTMAENRRIIAEIYCEVIDKENLPVEMQDDLLNPRHALHLFPILIRDSPGGKKRNRVLKEMRKLNIGVTVHYKPLHQHEFYKSFVPQTDLPNTEYVGDSVLTLPISASITEDEARFVAQGLKSALHLSDKE